MKKYGGSPARLGIGVMKPVKDLLPNEPSVNLVCKVINLNSRELEREGSSKEIYYGILADDTGTVPFTAWEVRGLDIQEGDVVRVQNAYTKEFRGQVQVNFGSRTTVTKDEGSLLEVSAVEKSAPTPCKLGEVREGMGNLSITARILSVERREVEVSGQAKVVFSGLLADETGKVQFSSWHDFGLKEGDVIRIEGGYVSSWRGLPQFSFDERAHVEKVKETSLPPLDELGRSRRLWIEELIQRGGGIDVLVRGIVVEIKEGSGLIHRCPQCRRVVRKGTCRVHGDVQGEPDLRTKAVIDDGSGALTAILNRELTEALLKKDLEASISEAKEAMDQEVIRDHLADLLIAQPVEVRGNVTSDDYGLMMIARSTRVLQVDIQQEASALLEQLGV
ncbi:MAG: DNA-binding protein [Thermoplasmata archaeon]